MIYRVILMGEKRITVDARDEADAEVIAIRIAEREYQLEGVEVLDMSEVEDE